MKYLLISLLLCSQLCLAQIFSNNPHLTKNKVSGQWTDGSIVLTDGTTIEGQVRGHSYKAHDVRSFRFRDEKGAKAFTYGADECKQVVQNGLIIVSLPKNLKKPEGKRRFYVALYHGEKFSVLQDPKVSSAAGGGGAGLVFNQGEMLSFLAYKDGELVKINKLNFKKKIKKLLSDNKQCLDKMKDKKWFKYGNIYEIADHYNQTQ